MFELDTFPIEEAEEWIFLAEKMEDYPPIKSTIMGRKDSNCGIVLQHGLIGSNLEMIYMANFLAEKGYRVAIPLLPGHGQDYKQLRKFNRTDWKESTLEAIRHLKIEKQDQKIVIAGHSLGGTITLNIGAQLRSIEAIIVMGAPISFPKVISFVINRLSKVNLCIKYNAFFFVDQRLHNSPYKEFLQKIIASFRSQQLMKCSHWL